MSCCVPGNRDLGADEPDRAENRPPGAGSGPTPVGAEGRSPGSDRVPIEAAEYEMGTSGPVAYPQDGETFVHQVRIDPFAIDRFAVSNDRFAAFVADTAHVTDAERYGWSFVFGGLLPDDFEETRGVVEAPWWRQVFGASWGRPEGLHSDLSGRGDHPVIHISHDDALAFCRWDGSSLPTEAQWEFAARGGLAGVDYPWGDQREPDGRHRMNVWQGEFPAANTMEDGHFGPGPVDGYEPNGHGLYNMCGNVWEWCADWFAGDYYHTSPIDNPAGPSTGQERVMRGGSYLCHESYCHRYRVGARSSSGPDSSAGNLGFRTVARI